MKQLIGKRHSRGALDSELLRIGLLRRRVHQSWKITTISALIGGVILSSAQLVSGLGFFLVMLVLLLIRPGFELYFSARAFCPHCDADLFMDLCSKENREGIDSEFHCPYCGKDAKQIDPHKVTVLDV